MDEVLNGISFHVTEQDNQTCFLSWVHEPPHAQILYSTWLILKQGWVSTLLFQGRIPADVPEMAPSQLGYPVVSNDQSRTQTVPQPGPPQASRNWRHPHTISQKEAQQKNLPGSSQDKYFKHLQMLYATSTVLHGYMMQIFETNSSTLCWKLNRQVILAINSYYVSLAQYDAGGRS